MKIKLKETPDQIELIRAMGSRDLTVAAEAQEAFAAFVGPVIQQVINQAATSSRIYTTQTFDEDSEPSIPLDLFYSDSVNTVQVWSQSIAGGLPTSQIEGVKELKVSTYRLDSAVSWLKKWARRSRLDVASKGLQRMAQEILVKQESNAWAVALSALAQASTKGLRHTITSANAGVLAIGDFNALLVRGRRISASFANGTPDPNASFGPTDLYVSPEVKGQIRNFAYNPMNTVGSTSTGPVPLPNNVREEIYRSGGASEIFGIAITDLIELGLNQKYNVLFGAYAAAGIAHSSANFSSATNEILIGVDASREGLVRMVAKGAESGGEVTTATDDQFLARADKIGFYSFVEEGRVCIDSRTLFGIII